MIHPHVYTTRRRHLTTDEVAELATMIGFTPEQTLEVRLVVRAGDVIAEVDSLDDE